MMKRSGQAKRINRESHIKTAPSLIVCRIYGTAKFQGLFPRIQRITQLYFCPEASPLDPAHLSDGLETTVPAQDLKPRRQAATDARAKTVSALARSQLCLRQI